VSNRRLEISCRSSSRKESELTFLPLPFILTILPLVPLSASHMAMLEEKAKNDRAVAASESSGVISLVSEGEEDYEGSVSQSSSKKLKQSSLAVSATGAFSLRGEQKQTKEVPLFVGGEKGRTSTFFHTPTPTDLSVLKKVESVALVKPAEMEVDNDALAEPVLLYMSDISAELTMEYTMECDSSVPREPLALVSAETVAHVEPDQATMDESADSSSTKSLYGVPEQDENGLFSVRLWPLLWAPKGFTMPLPTQEIIMQGRTKKELRNFIGKGIGGHIPLGIPVPTCDNLEDKVNRLHMSEFSRLVDFYRNYHELWCIHTLINKPCSPCTEPPEASALGFFGNKMKEQGADPEMQFLGNLVDVTIPATKGKGMGYGASQCQGAAETREIIREITGIDDLILPGFVLGATGGMLHALNLQYELWTLYGEGEIPAGALYDQAGKYDVKNKTRTQFDAASTASLAKRETQHGEKGDYYKFLVGIDAVRETNYSKSGSAVTNWAKARAATGETTYKGALKEHDDVNGSKFADAIDAPAVASFLSSITDPTIAGRYHANAAEHDASGGGETNFSKSGPAVTNWASVRAATGETTYKGALK